VLGIKESKAALSANVAIVPNPSEGIFSLIFTLANEATVRVSITNSMGQLISDDSMAHVNTQVFDIDLSSKPNGIYFVTVSTGSEKTVKKIVVNH
jgi:hypothetical protein